MDPNDGEAAGRDFPIRARRLPSSDNKKVNKGRKLFGRSCGLVLKTQMQIGRKWFFFGSCPDEHLSETSIFSIVPDRDVSSIFFDREAKDFPDSSVDVDS